MAISDPNLSRLYLKGLIQDALDGQKTGGLTWHLTAWWAQKRWSNTKQSIERFLLQSPTQAHRKLLLIGGSAGWMMSTPWISQFEHIELIDIDPLAALLFRIRHHSVFKDKSRTFHFERRDGILELPNILKQHPDGLIWFDNVLGQQCYRFKDEDWVEKQLKFIKILLKDRAWGSVHDMLSGPTLVENPFDSDPAHACLSLPIQWSAKPTPIQDIPTSAQTPAAPRTIEKDIDDFDLPHLITLNGEEMNFQLASQRLLSWVQACGIWQDHLSAEVFPLGSNTELIAWPFKSNYCHWLQAGFCNL